MIEAKFDHVILPKTCSRTNGGCSTSQWTYVWNNPRDRCPLRKIQEGEFQLQNSYLIDHQQKLLFQTRDESPTQEGCPPGKLFHTQQKGIILLKQKDYPWLDIDNYE